MKLDNKFLIRDNVTNSIKTGIDKFDALSVIPQLLVLIVFALIYIGDAIISLKEKE